MANYFVEKKGAKVRLSAKRDSTGRSVSLTGWVDVKKMDMKKVEELLRMANLGARVSLAKAYALFPKLKEAS